MIFLEMSREEEHGGGSWAFPNCVWSPSVKENGSKWPFWEKVLSIQEGDTVLHLRGVHPNAFFVGYSTATGNGFVTSKRPPHAGAWSFAPSFHKADLSGFTPFYKPISLKEIFSGRRTQLEVYFDANKMQGKHRKNIFFVRQAGRLQCLNGAYLSEVDEDLFLALFGEAPPAQSDQPLKTAVSVETGFQLKTIQTRIGQTEFSKKVKQLYRHRCCFPSCEINDPRFLVGAHIARWSDNELLRGHLGNGLCLCVFHDKAFELGVFTLDEHHRVFLNPREKSANSSIASALLPYQGRPIAHAEVPPLDDALIEHWIRCDLSP
jgi:putative restriction endonuclease